MSWLKEQWQQVRGNAKWDGVKFVARLVTPFLLPIGYGMLQAMRRQPLEWGMLIEFVVISLILLALMNRQKVLPKITAAQQKPQDQDGQATERIIADSKIADVKPQPESSDRIFVDVTPNYLMNLFNDHTSI